MIIVRTWRAFIVDGVLTWGVEANSGHLDKDFRPLTGLTADDGIPKSLTSLNAAFVNLRHKDQIL